MSTEETKQAAALNRFLRELAQDRAAGREVSVSEYQARFPGFEALVAAEFARLAGPGGFPPPFTGGWLGPYRLERELGRGGQGTVYLARDTRLDRAVAIKVLSGFRVPSAEALSRFRREAALAARLDHPGICAVHEAGEFEQVPYVVMQYVPGESLAQRIASAREHSSGRGAADLSSVAHIDWCLGFAEGAAHALHAAHERGVVHRDVKPGNLMVTDEGRPVVLDFGLAREVGGDSLTATGDILGTPSYMAPEQVDPRQPPDARTDVYSLAASLYDLLTLRPPFKAATREGIYRQILTERPGDPRATNPGVSRDLRVVLETALEKEPDRRYQTALDFAADLRAVREGRSIAARPVGPFGRALRWVQREPLMGLLAASALAALVLAAGLGGFLLARRPVLEAGRQVFDRRERDALVASALSGRFTDQTQEAMESILASEPNHGAMRHALALLHHREGRGDQALEVLDAAPADTDAPRLLQRMRVDVLTAQGREAEAARMERELGEPSGAWECWWIARQRLDENPMIDPEQTRPLLERAITLADEPRESFYSDLVRATPDQAVRDRAGDALELHFADSASAWFFIAMARVARDQEASLAALEHALEIDPDFPQALTMLAIFRVLSGEIEEAVELQERGIANTRGVAERIGLRHAFAATLERNEHADPALEQLDRILEERPDHVETLLLRGELLGRMGLARHGRSSFERALELEPENARARAGLGQ